MQVWSAVWLLGSVGVAAWAGYRGVKASSTLARAALLLIAAYSVFLASTLATSFNELMRVVGLTAGLITTALYVAVTNSFKARVHQRHDALLAKHGVRVGSYPSTSLSQTHRLLSLARDPSVVADADLAGRAADAVSVINSMFALIVVLAIAFALRVS